MQPENHRASIAVNLGPCGSIRCQLGEYNTEAEKDRVQLAAARCVAFFRGQYTKDMVEFTKDTNRFLAATFPDAVQKPLWGICRLLIAYMFLKNGIVKEEQLSSYPDAVQALGKLVLPVVKNLDARAAARANAHNADEMDVAHSLVNLKHHGRTGDIDAAVDITADMVAADEDYDSDATVLEPELDEAEVKAAKDAAVRPNESAPSPAAVARSSRFIPPPPPLPEATARRRGFIPPPPPLPSAEPEPGGSSKRPRPNPTR
jgi:hypothetical protein